MQKQDDWQNSAGYIEVMVQGSVTKVSIFAKTSGNYTVAIDFSGVITVDKAAATPEG